MVKIFEKHIKELKEFDKQRIFWLRLSGFVSLVVVLTILDWNHIIENKYLWLFFTSGLTLAVIWWYWTMMLIRKLLTHKQIESQALLIILEDIRQIRQNVTENFHKKT